MKLRDVLFWAHLSSGVTAGIVILIMSATGVLLAFEPQIVDSAEKSVRFLKEEPDAGATKLGLNELLAKAKAAQGDAKPASVILRSENKASFAVGFGKEGTVFLNPYTGDVLGTGSKTHEVMHVIEDWHRWLGNKEKGRPITGICNVLFLILALTGFYLWWPKKWAWPGLRAILAFNPSLSGKARDWNWHNVIGFWSAPFLVIIIVSGMTMSYPWANDLLYRMAGSEPPPAAKVEAPMPQSKEGKRAKSKDEPQVDLDKAFAMATEKVPAWVAITIRLPQKPDAPLNVSIEEPGYLHPRSQLGLDAKTYEVKKWEPASEQSKGRKWRTLARYLHTGEAAGIIGQIIAFVVACGAVMLVWTGLSMVWRRFFCANKIL